MNFRPSIKSLLSKWESSIPSSPQDFALPAWCLCQKQLYVIWVTETALVILYVAGRITVKTPLIVDVGVRGAPLSLSSSSHCVTTGFFVMWPGFFAWPWGQSAWIAALGKGPIRFQWGLYFTHFQLLCSLLIFVLGVSVSRRAEGVMLFYLQLD